jgi:hypothetical protein
MVALQEAYKHVARLPELGSEDPGPFAFASEQRVRRIVSLRQRPPCGRSALAPSHTPSRTTRRRGNERAG